MYQAILIKFLLIAIITGHSYFCSLSYYPPFICSARLCWAWLRCYLIPLLGGFPAVFHCHLLANWFWQRNQAGWGKGQHTSTHTRWSARAPNRMHTFLIFLWVNIGLNSVQRAWLCWCWQREKRRVEVCTDLYPNLVELEWHILSPRKANAKVCVA